MSSRRFIAARRCTSSIRGARSSAQWADTWLGLDVGTDIALANTVAREIIHAGLANEASSSARRRALTSTGRRSSRGRSRRASGSRACPAQTIRELAHAYARAERAILCWTLGITEHVTAVDNVLSLINLALLTGHVGRYGLGLEPAARPEQRSGRRRHGRDPEQASRLPGRREDRRGACAVRGGLGHASCRRSTAGTSRRCSRRWSAASCGRCT